LQSGDIGLELAAFIDTGLAWNTSNQFNTDHSRTGYGFGIRTLLPTVGEVRFDLAFSGEGDVTFNFATWPKFVAQRQRLR
jgi:outer membrane translocation and assembly module TamA